MAGEVRDMALEDWQRIVDVNLWGVINGTTSAYQVMVSQGFGHIINTASAAGLIPIPMGTAYVTTKDAVVGLSTSLRAEAAGLGVKVSVVCPGGIQTSIIDSLTLFNIQRDVLLSKIPFTFMDADKCTHVILRGVARNKGIITVTALARLSWWLYRLQPALFTLSARKIAQKFRTLRSEP
jgi:short-subunit dehydrogenase